MRVASRLLLLVAVASLASLAPSAAPIVHESTGDAGAGLRLVWSDEFDRPGGPDPANWTYETGFVRNHEAQYYQPENARVIGGLLVIEAKRERRTNDAYVAESADWRTSRREADYTSACLKTKGLHAWRYGRFEIRARVDTRPGLWPAFWTLGAEGAWPANGEIDVMEVYRGLLLANVAWASSVPNEPIWDSVKMPLDEIGDARWSRSFHVWRLDWDERELRISVDGRTLNTTDLTSTENRTRDRANPFRQPHYLLLNMAIGGDSGGDPSKTKFPARFEVDYVRVYQRTEERQLPGAAAQSSDRSSASRVRVR